MERPGHKSDSRVSTIEELERLHLLQKQSLADFRDDARGNRGDGDEDGPSLPEQVLKGMRENTEILGKFIQSMKRDL